MKMNREFRELNLDVTDHKYQMCYNLLWILLNLNR